MIASVSMAADDNLAPLDAEKALDERRGLGPRRQQDAIVATGDRQAALLMALRPGIQGLAHPLERFFEHRGQALDLDRAIGHKQEGLEQPQFQIGSLRLVPRSVLIV